MDLPYGLEFPGGICKIPDDLGGNMVGRNIRTKENHIVLMGKCKETNNIGLYVTFVNRKVDKIYCGSYNKGNGGCNSNPSINCPFHGSDYKITNEPIELKDDNSNSH